MIDGAEGIARGGAQQRKRKRKARAAAGWLLASVLLGAPSCGRSADGDRDRVELVSSWLGSCTSDAECAEGSCVCGVCTLACEDDATCAADGLQNARCVDPEHWASAALCAGRASTGLCLSRCAEPADCDTGLECLGGLCLSDTAAGIARGAELGPAGGWCEREGVLWRSLSIERQDQVDAVRGCERIAGDVTILPFAGADFSPFATVAQIDGTLSIGLESVVDAIEANAGSTDVSEIAFERWSLSLHGFERLARVGGLSLAGLELEGLGFDALRTVEWIEPGGFPAEPTFTAEPAEVAAQSRLAIAGCAGFRTLSGLGRLERVKSLVLRANADLQSLAGLGGSAAIEYLFLLRNPALSSLDGFPAPAELEELHIEGSPLVDSLAPLSGLARVGSLYVAGSSIRDLEGLEGLTAIDSLGLESNPALVSLAGLGDTRGLGTLRLSSNTALSSLEGFEAPQAMAALAISSSPSLSSLVQLSGLELIDSLDLSGVGVSSLAGLEVLHDAGSIAIVQTPVESLAGLGALRTAAVFQAFDNPALTDLAGMTALERVDSVTVSGNALTRLSLGAARVGDLSVEREPLASLSGLEQARVAGLSLGQLPALVSLDGLGAISPDALVDITACPVLSNVDALGSVTNLGRLSISDTSLTNLDPLSNLRRLGTLTLMRNPTLTQVDALAQAAGVTVLTVQDNPALASLPAFSALPCEGCMASVQVSNNALLAGAVSLPGAEQGDFIYVNLNPRLTGLELPALRSAIEIQITGNPALTELDLGSLESVERVLVLGTALPEAELTQVRAAIPADPRVPSKIASNAEGPSSLDPCPSVNDFFCDERFEECASGTDASDCASYYEELAAAGSEGEVP